MLWDGARADRRPMSSTTTTVYQARQGQRHALLALAVGAFAIGVCELAAIGVIDPLSDDLGISTSSAGWIVATYAAGVCLGGPLLATQVGGRDPRRVLLGALLVFALCTAAMAAAPSFWLMLVTRGIAGSVHGLYVGVATAHASRLSSPVRKGQAVALVFGGITVATVVGAPLGAILADLLGWRSAFVAVAIAGALALVGVARAVPGRDAASGREPAPPLRDVLRLPVLMALGLIVPLMGGIFTLYTYVTTFLTEHTGMGDGGVSAILLLFGAASAIGTLAGGWLADRFAAGAMILTGAVTTAALGGLVVLGDLAAPAAALLALCGLAGFAFVPAYQLRVMSLAGDGAQLAATLGASAANAGIVVGSVLGGAVLKASGTAMLAPTATVLCAVSLGAVLLTAARADARVVTS